MDWRHPLWQNLAGGSWRRTLLYRLSHLRYTPRLCPRAIPPLDLYPQPQWWNQVQSVHLCSWYYSPLSCQDPYWLHPTTGWLQNIAVLGKEVANIFQHTKMPPTDWPRKGTGFSPATPSTTKPWESCQCKVPWRRVDREPPLEETYAVNCCKS